MIFRIFICILLLTSHHSFAAESTPKQSFQKINACVKKGDSNGCRDFFTADSMDIYNRFISYDLMGCLPKDAKYFSEANIDNNVLLRAKVTDYGKERYVRLLFTEEEGVWKLDIPQSLKISMGKNWEKQLQMAENIYLMMKQNMGKKLDCKLIRSFVQPKK